MCLAVPGRLEDKDEGSGEIPFGTVRFGSVARRVCLAYTPEAQPGDYLVVHVGFSIQRLDEAAARRALQILSEALDDEVP